jgi:16S rRNA processing protein RimM
VAAARGAMAVLGEVVGSYGVRGWLKIRPFSEYPDALLGFATWWLRPARAAEWREFATVGGRMHSGALLAGLHGIETREAALALKGSEVGIPRASLPAAPAGEIYWDDLTGLAVVNRTGVLLGEVRGLIEHGAHPLLRVARPPETPGPERLIPYVPAIVDRVDVGAGRIEVDWGADY